ncbi:MAG: serine protease [Planctomycetes bacterium]|nr:serine protease [Planctomycetota bacterium]
MKRSTILTLAALAAALLPGPRAAAGEDLAPKLRGALLRVYSTSQSWQVASPWNKSNPTSGVQRGVMVRPGLVLTPIGSLANCIMVEVSEANSARRYPASLVHVDYAANLALVKVADESLSTRLAPLPVGEPITIDDEFEIWQLGGAELLERATGRVQAVYPSGPRLELTIKTTLGDNGDGQAALKDGQVVGLVTRTNPGRQEGTLLSIETIRHFLADFDSGDYRGFGSFGFHTHQLLRDDLKAWYSVPEGRHGVGVSRVLPGRTGDGAVAAGDVILSLAGYELDDEGMFVHEKHGRLHHSYLLYGTTHPGDLIPAKILRKGEEIEVKLPIRGWPYEEQRIPMDLMDRRPPFLVAGGLVILELSRRSPAGGSTLRQYQARAMWDPPDDRKRIVYLSRVLADLSNKGLDELGNFAILTVNGERIRQLPDVIEALKKPMGGFHVFTFEDLAPPFVIKASELETIDKRIADRYKIPELFFLE